MSQVKAGDRTAAQMLWERYCLIEAVERKRRVIRTAWEKEMGS
jgi:hypothetical protein